MPIIYPLTGLLLGMVVAFVLHKLTAFLRLPAIVAWVAGFGWFVFTAALSVALFLIWVWVSSVGDPFPGMLPLWGMLGMFLLAVLGIGARTGTVQARRHAMTWAQAFGVVMTKYALVAGLMFLFAYLSSGFGGQDAFPFWYACCVSQLFVFMTLEIALP